MTSPVEDARAGFARRAEEMHERGDSDGALRLLTQGARRFPGDVTALIVLAQICQDSGREAEARDWIRAALRLDPGCPAARAADADTVRPEIRDPASASPPHNAFLQPEARIVPRKPATVVPSAFTFPVHEEDEEPETDGNSAPHIATVTLAEIYLQQGLKEQAAHIYRQLLERQPDDDSVRERLQDILREIEEP